MLISFSGIKNLLVRGVVVGAKPEAVNAASLDIHLGRYILEEVPRKEIGGIPPYHVICLSKREPLNTRQIDLEKNGPYLLKPGHFILAHSEEMFNLPNDISAEYKLTSSPARVAIDHANAGWCDAGWNGSSLTLELVNQSRHHAIILTQGDVVGQMIFFSHEAVPEYASYANRGSYNGDKVVQGPKKGIQE